MMVVNVEDDIVRVVILDISGVYAQIYDQGYFNAVQVNEIKEKYSNIRRWRVLILG